MPFSMSKSIVQALSTNVRIIKGSVDEIKGFWQRMMMIERLEEIPLIHPSFSRFMEDDDQMTCLAGYENEAPERFEYVSTMASVKPDPS
ncbi:hypothetical protein E3N88_03208 [Mikania micrantha]|uniref:Uncharacterized protein n=1 Tax=Mikania micrantha TaxID=192012 RepID=A0A5N6Q633_9ASTR|nr:hypothetical protein E3N88_03208 [Mikania micrantha]